MPQRPPLWQTNKSLYADSVLQANRHLDWVQRLYEKNTPTLQVPGQEYLSTHFMADDDKGYVFPTIVREKGNLKYLAQDAEDYARRTKTGIQLPKEQGDWFGRGGYKTAPGVLTGFNEGGKMATPGTTFRELIQHATSKDAATREDFESAMSARGYAPGDVRKLGRAFDRVSGSGSEYILHPDKGFNVFEGGKQKSGSGKAKGNKAGADLGDLIGLGNEVSLLAGALRKEVPSYEKAKTISQKAITPEHPAVKLPTVKGSIATKTGATTVTPIKKAKPSGELRTTPGNPMYYEPPSKSNEPKTFNWEDITSKFGAFPTLRGGEYPAIDTEDFWDMSGFKSARGFSDLAKKTKDDLITLGQVGATAGPFARTASKFYNKALLPLQLMGLGTSAAADAIDPNRDLDWGQTGEDAAAIIESTLGANIGNLFRAGRAARPAQEMERQLLRQGKAARPGTTPSSFLRNLYERSANRVGYPGVVKEPLQLPEYKVPFEMGMGHEQGFGMPGTPEYFPPGGYEEGGKLPQGGNGIKTPKEPVAMSRYAQDFWGNNPWEERPSDQQFQFPVPATQGEKPIYTGPGYGERPGANDKSGTSDGQVGGSVVAGLVKYGIPAAYLGAEQAQLNRLRGKMNPNLVAPELMVGAVQDLPRPDFSLPYEHGLTGSSLQEAQNAGLARARFTREGRNNWEMQNALNRQAQKNAIIDRINQQTQAKAAITNQSALIRAGNAANEFGYLMGDRSQTAASLFGNLDQGIADTQDAKDTKNLMVANAIMRNPDSPQFTEEDRKWARGVFGIGRQAQTKKATKSVGGRFSRQTY